MDLIKTGKYIADKRKSLGLTQKQVQNSKKFKESLNEMSQKTGLTSKQIKSYLSWMKHEQYFKQYKQQMKMRYFQIMNLFQKKKQYQLFLGINFFLDVYFL